MPTKKGKGSGQKVATYFLAKKSGLFAPGAPLILANLSIVNASKPKLGLRKEGQKASKWAGGGSGGGINPTILPVLDNVHWYIYGF